MNALCFSYEHAILYLIEPYILSADGVVDILFTNANQMSHVKRSM